MVLCTSAKKEKFSLFLNKEIKVTFVLRLLLMAHNTAGTGICFSLVQSYIYNISVIYCVIAVEVKKSTSVKSVADASGISEYLPCILQQILSLVSSTVAALE